MHLQCLACKYWSIEMSSARSTIRFSIWQSFNRLLWKQSFSFVAFSVSKVVDSPSMAVLALLVIVSESLLVYICKMSSPNCLVQYCHSQTVVWSLDPIRNMFLAVWSAWHHLLFKPLNNIWFILEYWLVFYKRKSPFISFQVFSNIKWIYSALNSHCT